MKKSQGFYALTVLILVAGGIFTYFNFRTSPQAMTCNGPGQFDLTSTSLNVVGMTGAWEGIMGQGGREATLRLDFHVDANCLGVRVSMPKSALFFLPAETIEAGENNLSFSMQGAPYRIDLNPLPGNEGLTGTWVHTRYGVEAPFKLSLITDQAMTFQTRDVSFSTADGANLVGTLILPEGDGPFPAVVWTHGSGPDTRATAYYASRGYWAASLGMAALIYDKRGYGQSTGPAPWDIMNNMDDAVAALEAVRNEPDINAKHVGVGGYSQGGWISPAAAARSPETAFVIVGAAPGITPAEQNVFSLYSEALKFFGPEVAEDVATGLRMVYAYYQTGEGYEEVKAYLNQEENQVWSNLDEFKRFYFTSDNELPENVNTKDYKTLFYDPLPDWQKVKSDVIAFWGANDADVPAAKSRDLISAALMEGGNESAEFLIFEGTDHGLMQIIPLGDNEYDWNRAAEGYVEAFSSWISDRVDESK